MVVEKGMAVKLASITLFRAALLCTSLVIVPETQAQSTLPVCPLIATGGTIAMKIDPVKF